MAQEILEHCMKLTDLTIEQQIRLLDQINARTNQDQQTIEKDWWVTQVLKAYFHYLMQKKCR